jgi:hypothetical protein
VAVGGNILSLGALIRDIKQLEVPDFQRNYSWQAENVDAFMKDLSYSAKQDRSHFLGSTILMKKSVDSQDKTYQIIDGQQRLTTTFLVIAIIRDLVIELPDQELPPLAAAGVSINVAAKANELLFFDQSWGKTRFVSNYLLRGFLSQYVFRNPGPDRPEIPKKHQNATLALRKAYLRIRETLRDDLKEFESFKDQLAYLNSVLTTMSDNFTILKIETADQTESYDIFMTLNNRGLALGPSDLIKSLFMKHLTVGFLGDELQMKNQELTTKWSEATESIDDGDMNQFLRHYLLATQDKSVRGKDIFGKIEEIVERTEGVSPSIASANLLEDIVFRAGIYASLLKPSEILDDHVRSTCVTMREVLDSYRIFMLNVLDPRYKLEQSQIRELSRCCELLSLRWVLTGGNAQKLEDHFQSTANLLRKEPIDYNQIKTTLLSKLPVDDTSADQFKNEIESSSFVRTVLHNINARLNDPDTLIAYDPKRIHVEHIAPDSPSEHWLGILFPGKSRNEVASEYASVVENWGNKTLLDRNINLKIKQKPFEAKRDGDETFPGYANAVMGITKDLNQVPSWSIDEIKIRNLWIADCFIKIWSEHPREHELLNYSEFRKTAS